MMDTFVKLGVMVPYLFMGVYTFEVAPYAYHSSAFWLLVGFGVWALLAAYFFCKREAGVR